MRYHILTLFPEMVSQGLHESIIGRAVDRGVTQIMSMERWMITLTGAGPAW